MSEVCNLKDLVNDSLVSELFNQREDKISNRTIEEKEELKKLLNKSNKDYENILVAINNIPDGFVETKKCIKESIDTKLETINEIGGYENEKFYKAGVYDGVNFILECLKKWTYIKK